MLEQAAQRAVARHVRRQRLRLLALSAGVTMTFTTVLGFTGVLPVPLPSVAGVAAGLAVARLQFARVRRRLDDDLADTVARELAAVLDARRCAAQWN